MNNSTIRRLGRLLTVALAALMLGSGCVATTGGSAAHREANQREDYELIQERMRRLDGDMESLRLQIEQMSRDLQRVQANSATAAQSQTAVLQSTMNQLDDRIQSLEVQREKDRAEIVDTLSREVARLVNQATAAPARPDRGSPAPTGYGYEHIVQAGETLSQIAKAYGTTVSAIQKANNLPDAHILKIDQKLFIPE